MGKCQKNKYAYCGVIYHSEKTKKKIWNKGTL